MKIILKFMKGKIIFSFAAAVAVGSFFAAASALAAGPAPVDFLSADNFVILTKTGVTDTGSHTSAIVGNIGASPITAASVSDVFCSEITGTIYGVDAAYVGSGDQTCFAGNPPLANKTLVDNAVLDMTTAYADAAGRTNPTATELGGGNIGGMTLAPGLYKWGTDVTIPTDVTISGGANDVWIFQIAGNLNISSFKNVILAGGAEASNVFWQVGGVTGATLGTYSTFNGNILSDKQVIIQTGAVLNGRALAQTQVTLDVNAVFLPPAVAVSPGSLLAEDFGVMNVSGVKGYTAGFGLTNATFAGAKSVVMKLYASSTLLQTNTATSKVGTDITGIQISSPFDVLGTFDYAADGYWTNVRGSEYGLNLAPTKVVATVTLANGKVVTAENTVLTGDTAVIILPAGTLLAEDFGSMNVSGVNGYTAGFGLTNGLTFANASSVVMQLFSGTTLLQTNTSTSKVATDITGAQISSPFDVFGTFNYTADGYWTNVRGSEYGQVLIPTKVVATVTLGSGQVVTAENSSLTGTLVTLQSIATATPATKLTFTVGDILDTAGLTVLGTYSDTSTSTISITPGEVTGFNSSAPALGQVLTVTLAGKTLSYTVDIVAAAPANSGGGGGGTAYYNLTVTKNGDGSGSITANGSVCNGSCGFPAGSTVTLTATPLSGSSFAGWTGSCSGSASTCSVVLNGLNSVGASFALNSGSSNNNQVGQVLGESVIKNGVLVLNNGTVYFVLNNQKRPFASAEEFFSYGFKFSDVLTNVDISNMETGPVMRAMDGTLVLDTTDNRTVYMIGAGGTKRGFTLPEVFEGLGYNFSQIKKIDVSSYQVGPIINSGIEQHPDGALTLNNNVVSWVNSGQLHVFPSTDVLNSYGFTSDLIVKANTPDTNLSVGNIVQSRDQALADGSLLK